MLMNLVANLAMSQLQQIVTIGRKIKNDARVSFKSTSISFVIEFDDELTLWMYAFPAALNDAAKLLKAKAISFEHLPAEFQYFCGSHAVKGIKLTLYSTDLLWS